ncbi:B12-binding domain-containing radical SAM protein [Desulfonema magnum]|uniref:Radical SAM domain-containing protein n=1 Tax=Desulfonema magnum TaxID=45655 RepID=A0A975BLZ4_9BACT|nr:radical SAM protein [Desulfonema magnum]QTA87906.1 Radical SAM domain-containing protein [Desulfonema magnum]
MTKIAIIFPTPIATIPTGLTYVIKRFKQNGFDVRVFINTFKKFKNMDQIKNDVIDSFNPDVVGLSYGTYNILEVYRLQRLCKEGGYFVIAGGPHPSIGAEESLRHGADIVFRGEAELGIDDFCRWFTDGQDKTMLVKIRGASYIDSEGRVQHNKKPRRLMKTDELGEMDVSSIDLEPFTVADGSVKGLNVISCGRGCPFRCSFCSHSDWYAWGKRSVDSIIAEMVHKNEEYGITHFWMSDETFTIHKDRIHEFCKRLRNEKLPFTWDAGTRINCVDESLLKTMKEGGMTKITYGVESADDETLKKVNKGYSAKDAYETVLMTGKLGIPMYINLMTGFPWESVEHVENNIRFIKTVEKYVYCFQLYGAVIPYPDTGIYDEYHDIYGFTNWWMQEEFQDAGMVIYQNVANPYKVSTFFQRNLYDDTYVAEDYFFKFDKPYKQAVAKMGFLIGWKAICAQYNSPVKCYFKYAVGRGSQLLYEIFPRLEKRIVGSLIKTNKIHEVRLTGKFVEE